MCIFRFSVIFIFTERIRSYGEEGEVQVSVNKGQKCLVMTYNSIASENIEPAPVTESR